MFPLVTVETNSNLVSISSTFYIQIFCTNIIFLVMFWLWTNFHAKKFASFTLMKLAKGVNFTKVLRKAFTRGDPKKRKKTLSTWLSLALSWSERKKAAQKICAKNVGEIHSFKLLIWKRPFFGSDIWFLLFRHQELI